MSVSLALSNGALLARGDLLPFLAPIAGAMLVATAILPIVTAAFSTIPGQVTTTQEIAIVGLTAVTGATSAAVASDATGNLLATILVTVGITTALCGLAMIALGAFRLGRIIRFVPYPVFAGFLAMTGYYLIKGGLETVIGGHLELEHLAALAEPNTALKIGLAIAFVIMVEVGHRRMRSGAALPLTVLAAVILYNLAVLVLGIASPDLEEAGWLIGTPASSMNWPPVGIGELMAVNWRAVGMGLVFAPFVIAITTTAAMMNVSGIELNIPEDIDLNSELRSMGIGNLAAGLVGGIPGFPAVSTTMLTHRLGTAYRVTGVATGLFAVIALIFAREVLGLVPLPLLGALLIWVGVSLTMEWLVAPIRTLRRSEYAIILVILGVSIGAGLPAGIGTGIVAALILFVVEYARVDGIRFVASGRDLHSRAITDERRSLMAGKGDAISIIKLGGFVFFGTSDRIVQRIVAEATEARRAGSEHCYAILDFSRVSGFDSSTVLSFERLRRIARRERFTVVFAGLGALAPRLVAGGLDIARAPFHHAHDLESALHWTESQVLGAPEEAPQSEIPAETSLGRLLGDEGLARAISPYLHRVDYMAGERLIEQGATADDIYVIETGRGAVVLESNGLGTTRVLDFGPGTILGEVAFYGTESRSASAVADTPGLAWRLSRSALARVEAEQPTAASAFHRALGRVLAGRLQSANRLIRVLAD